MPPPSFHPRALESARPFTTVRQSPTAATRLRVCGHLILSDQSLLAALHIPKLDMFLEQSPLSATLQKSECQWRSLSGK